MNFHMIWSCLRVRVIQGVNQHYAYHEPKSRFPLALSYLSVIMINYLYLYLYLGSLILLIGLNTGRPVAEMPKSDRHCSVSRDISVGPAIPSSCPLLLEMI